jgi:hypothetical protein
VNPAVAQADVMSDVQSGDSELSRADLFLLFGRHAPRIAQIVAGAPGRDLEIRIFHPSGTPPQAYYVAQHRIVVYVPSIDENGDGYRWGKWAKSVGATIVTSTGSGSDIRTVWPAIAQQVN